LTGSWSSRYSRVEWSGSIEIADRFSRSSTSLKPISARLKIFEARSWPATSQTIVRFPRAAAAIPSASETVVLPTPPLPVTNRIRLSSRSAIGAFSQPRRRDLITRGRKPWPPTE
jgi:hypothetical protein